MADTRTILKYKILLIVIGVVSLGIIVFFARHFSRAAVTTSVTEMHQSSTEKTPKEVEKTSLQKLFESKKLKTSPKPLARPLKRLTGKVPVDLTAAHPEISIPELRVRLTVTPKNYKMGNNDRFLVTLTMENRSRGPLVYRVVTRKTPSFVECISHSVKRTHHGFLLGKGETVERFEGCAFSREVTLKVEAFQVMPLPEVGLLTLGRIETPLGLPPRLEKSHKPSRSRVFEPCPIYADKERLNKRIAKNPRAWFEIMDFFARNDCAQDTLP